MPPRSKLLESFSSTSPLLSHLSSYSARTETNGATSSAVAALAAAPSPVGRRAAAPRIYSPPRKSPSIDARSSRPKSPWCCLPICRHSLRWSPPAAARSRGPDGPGRKIHGTEAIPPGQGEQPPPPSCSTLIQPSSCAVCGQSQFRVI